MAEIPPGFNFIPESLQAAPLLAFSSVKSAVFSI